MQWRFQASADKNASINALNETALCLRWCHVDCVDCQKDIIAIVPTSQCAVYWVRRALNRMLSELAARYLQLWSSINRIMELHKSNYGAPFGTSYTTADRLWLERLHRYPPPRSWQSSYGDMNTDLKLNIWNKKLKRANDKQERAFLPSHHVVVEQVFSITWAKRNVSI